MLYLLRSYGENGSTILKVGYAEIINKRMSQYKAENPLFKLLGEREGGKEEELCFHLYLRSLGYKYKKFREWFLDNEEVINSFSLSLETIQEHVWKNRRKFWTKSIINSKKNTLKKRLYNTLKGKYGGDLEDYKFDLKDLEHLENFNEEMKKIIEHLEIYPQDISNVPNKYMPYLVNFSVDEIKSCSYRKDDLDRKLKTKFGEEAKKTEKIIIEVYKVFSEGDVYTRKEIKKLLSGVYGPDISSKAIDINLYFETSRAQIVVDRITKKREDGFKLLKRKY